MVQTVLLDVGNHYPILHYIVQHPLITGSIAFKIDANNDLAWVIIKQVGYKKVR